MLEENEKERALELAKLKDEQELREDYDRKITELTKDYKEKLQDLDKTYMDKKFELQ